MGDRDLNLIAHQRVCVCLGWVGGGVAMVCVDGGWGGGVEMVCGVGGGDGGGVGGGGGGVGGGGYYQNPGVLVAVDECWSTYLARKL